MPIQSTIIAVSKCFVHVALSIPTHNFNVFFISIGKRDDIIVIVGFIILSFAMARKWCCKFVDGIFYLFLYTLQVSIEHALQPIKCQMIIIDCLLFDGITNSNFDILCHCSYVIEHINASIKHFVSQQGLLNVSWDACCIPDMSNRIQHHKSLELAQQLMIIEEWQRSKWVAWMFGNCTHEEWWVLHHSGKASQQ